MSQEHKIHKPKPISGFPEWLPEYRAVELQWMDKIRKVFESYGFCSIETPSVEEIEALTAKGGETEKEIYTLHRLQAEFDSSHSSDFRTTDPRLALHFDLTVPMARYVAQHFGALDFPFKRYQIQRVWRGERPQKGRFREFYQCDIDVVNIDTLPLHFDAELPAVLFEAYQALGIPPVELHISNRKIIMGYLQGLGLELDHAIAIARFLDKADKASEKEIIQHIGNALEIYKYPFNSFQHTAQKCFDITKVKTTDDSFIEHVKSFGIRHEMLDKGIEELVFVMKNLSHLPKGAVFANLGIIRGLDYYTGTVLETRFQGKPIAIGGGGRYDDLAGSFINQKLPGIGVSIGLTRLFSILMEEGYLKPSTKSPAHVLVVLPDEARRAEAAATANLLRSRGYNVEMYHRDAKIKNQLAYAEKKGIPYVWFPPFKDGQPHEVKNMATGEQTQADPQKWEMLK